MKRLETSDILKPGCEVNSRKISEEEFEPIYQRTIEAQNKVLEQKERSQDPSYEDLNKIINPYSSRN